MNDKEQPFDRDAAWLINQCQQKNIAYNDEMIDSFCERVAMLMSEHEYTEYLCRMNALEQILLDES